MRSITITSKDYTLEVTYNVTEDTVTVHLVLDDGETLDLEMEKSDALGLVEAIKQVLE